MHHSDVKHFSLDDFFIGIPHCDLKSTALTIWLNWWHQAKLLFPLPQTSIVACLIDLDQLLLQLIAEIVH